MKILIHKSEEQLSSVKGFVPKVLEPHRIVFNFTEKSMKLYESESDMAFRVDGIQKSELALNQCINSLLKRGVFEGNEIGRASCRERV